MRADYDVSYGILGKIGTAHCRLEVDHGTYMIEVEVESTGLAKFLSHDRKERYRSTGLIQKGKLVPKIFAKERQSSQRDEDKKYFFDHKAKSIKVMESLKRSGKSSAKVTMLPYYAPNDILTLFFNLDAMTKDSNLKQWLRLSAVGARKQDGAIDIKLPDEQEKREYQEILGIGTHLLMVALNQQIFSSKEGLFVIHIDKHGVCDRFVLKDVLLGGDLEGRIKNLKIEE